MANKLVPEELKKTNFTIKISKYVIEKVREVDGYNKILEEIIIERFNIEKPNVEK